MSPIGATRLTSECIPWAPVLFYDRPILDDLGKPGEACPVRSRFIIEVDIDMIVVLKLQKFWRGIVCDKNKVDLTLGVCWVIFVIEICPKKTKSELTANRCHGSCMETTIGGTSR